MRPKLLAAMLCVPLFGCASQSVNPTKNSRRTEAVASMRAAESAGAASVPQAARHLEFARQQVANGDHLLSEKDSERADLSYLQADADADLAQALARAVPLEQQAQQTTQQLESMRQSPR